MSARRWRKSQLMKWNHIGKRLRFRDIVGAELSLLLYLLFELLRVVSIDQTPSLGCWSRRCWTALFNEFSSVHVKLHSSCVVVLLLTFFFRLLFPWSSASDCFEIANGKEINFHRADSPFTLEFRGCVVSAETWYVCKWVSAKIHSEVGMLLLLNILREMEREKTYNSTSFCVRKRFRRKTENIFRCSSGSQLTPSGSFFFSCQLVVVVDVIHPFHTSFKLIAFPLWISAWSLNL